MQVDMYGSRGPLVAGYVMVLKHHKRWSVGRWRRTMKDNIKLHVLELSCGV